MGTLSRKIRKISRFTQFAKLLRHNKIQQNLMKIKIVPIKNRKKNRIKTGKPEIPNKDLDLEDKKL